MLFSGSGKQNIPNVSLKFHVKRQFDALLLNSVVKNESVCSFGFVYIRFTVVGEANSQGANWAIVSRNADWQE